MEAIYAELMRESQEIGGPRAQTNHSQWAGRDCTGIRTA